MKKAVVALGGNAISTTGKEDIHEQFANTRKSLEGIVELIQEGFNLSISHGNGPQGHGRQDEMFDAVQQRFGIPRQYAVHDDQVSDPLQFNTGIQPRHRRQPAQAHGEEPVEHQSQPENGH